MKIRRFNSAGMEQLTSFLCSLSTDDHLEFPYQLLQDITTSEALAIDIEIEQRSFVSRFEAAEYLNNIFSNCGLTNLEMDQGLWAWLSLFWFETLCPSDSSGKRQPGELARWIPAVTNFQRYYRHLLAGPYRIYRAHRDDPRRALALLCSPLNKPGDIVEQLASRQEQVTNKAVVEAATLLYLDSETGQPKRGAAGRGAGSVRRLAQVLNQLDITWDLYAMPAGGLVAVLPKEFDRFRPEK